MFCSFFFIFVIIYVVEIFCDLRLVKCYLFEYDGYVLFFIMFNF